MSNPTLSVVPEATWIDTPDVAKLIRAALKAAFPGVNFGVRSSRYAGGSSIYVNWTNGPTTREVERVTDYYQGAMFDGMQDLKISCRDRVIDGKPVKLGVDYVSCSRHVTDAARARLANFVTANPESSAAEDFARYGIWAVASRARFDDAGNYVLLSHKEN